MKFGDDLSGITETFIAFFGSLRISLFWPNAACHIEISHLTWFANQRTGFCMKCNTRLNWVEAKKKKKMNAAISSIKNYSEKS